MLKTLNQRISIVLFIIAVGYLVLTFQLPSYGYTSVDADVIPMVLGWLLAVLAVCLFFSKDSETEEQKARRDIPKKDLGVLIAVFAFIFVYIMFLELLGFVVVTGLFIFFCSWFLGYRKHITNLIVSILFPLLMYITFTELLKINLPQGILPF
ncbi:putative tricarboxylic transport membrane protein [Virgibacillus natechei]|uniref:Tricarboxylic transport membrane protein n=1 Tax=Virgibacillus natechei TaxID=1216297 RepID=A0ABS4IIM9_9BACI|nr:tripartite tricarboxylate transporter TctB family protein [Virgibacillus natechei]MBP1970733.1 putative tricarboxylic transport membrane protein [Virgibacillus natechei]UZD12028.1 tripartite tricarboxylate transporter TctB family protein [Virgibacillus natechei]